MTSSITFKTNPPEQDSNSILERVISLIYADNFREAIDICLEKLEENPEDILIKIKLGIAFLFNQEEENSQAIWLEIILQGYSEKLKESLEQEALLRLQLNKIDQAKAICLYLLELDENNEIGYQVIGDIDFQLNSPNAIQKYEKVLEINPENHEIKLKIANIYKAIGELGKAEEKFKELVRCSINLSDCFNNLKEIAEVRNDFLNVNLYKGLYFVSNYKYTEAIQVLKPLLKTDFQKERIYWIVLECYSRSGNNQDLFTLTEQAKELFPENLKIEIKSRLTLPIQYNNQEEIYIYRERFILAINYLKTFSESDLEYRKFEFLNIIESQANFFIAYQGFNDLELQKSYGYFIGKIMKLCFPEWTKPLNISEKYTSSKIKIAYISSNFFEHTVCKLFKGWLTHSDKNKFEITAYYTGKTFDEYTQKIIESSNYFYHVPNGFEDICQKIYDDQFDIIVYPEIGMEARIVKFAALRLAPIQCMAWGHPVTSGLQTIDYFLSSNLMEPENFNENYLEKLIALPNLSISYEIPNIPCKRLNRKDFGIQEDETLYLCCQSVYKYLPQYDHVFAKIAQRVPNSKFIFISTYNEELTQRFRHRLSMAFSQYDLIFSDYCVDVVPQDKVGYFSLNLIADVFLDTFDWSGGNTTLEAIACNLPVVTFPGEFMRGRHSFAILKFLEIDETVAQSVEDYISIAIKLGIDLNFRHQMIQKIAKFKYNIFDDNICIKALEKFYEDSVSTYSSMSR